MVDVEGCGSSPGRSWLIPTTRVPPRFEVCAAVRDVAGTCVSEEASRLMRRALEAQQIQDRLPRRLGDRVRVANKTGNFADVIHDAGIVAWPGGTLVIAVLTQGVCPPWQAMDAIADITAVLAQVCAESG